jgi:hypothetical protein
MSEEPWLRGPVEGVIAELQPVAHELVFAQEELSRIFETLTDEQVWQTPSGAASIAYHARHNAGSTLRMLTYARGEELTDEQFAMRSAESQHDENIGAADALRIANHAIERAMLFVRSVQDHSKLDEPRLVGRKRLVTNLRGLLYEIAIHTSRHVGQIATTAKLVTPGA